MNLNDDASQMISPEMKIWAARPSELPVLWDRSLTEIPLNSPLLEQVPDWEAQTAPLNRAVAQQWI